MLHESRASAESILIKQINSNVLSDTLLRLNSGLNSNTLARTGRVDGINLLQVSWGKNRVTLERKGKLKLHITQWVLHTHKHTHNKHARTNTHTHTQSKRAHTHTANARTHTTKAHASTTNTRTQIVSLPILLSRESTAWATVSARRVNCKYKRGESAKIQSQLELRVRNSNTLIYRHGSLLS